MHEIGGGVLWANLLLLFWLSLTPFVTGWMGENHFATLPVALYGLNLLMCAISYSLLVRCLTLHHHGNKSLAEAIGNDRKGRISLVMYIAGIGITWVHAGLGLALFAGVALMWLIPDRRIERRIAE